MFFISKRKNLLHLQRLLDLNLPNNSKLYFTEQQLYAEANRKAQSSLKIVEDCTRLVNTTTKPDVFFLRYNLLLEHLNILVALEKYVKFSGVMPSLMLQTVHRKKDATVSDFIQRCYDKTVQKASGLKTEKGKANAYINLFAELDGYIEQMPEQARKYYSSLEGYGKYSSYVSNIC